MSDLYLPIGLFALGIIFTIVVCKLVAEALRR